MTRNRAGLLCEVVAVAIGIMLIGWGCATSEATKQLNQQNQQAGALVEKDPTASPETRQAGSDVRQNSEAMAKELGVPKEKVPYTPQNSARFRDQVPDQPWYVRIWGDLWTFLGAFLAGGGAANLLGRLVPALAGPWGAIATTVIGAIAKGRSKAETKKDGSDAIRAILTQLESDLVDTGLQGRVKALAKAIECDEEIGHTVTLR